MTTIRQLIQSSPDRANELFSKLVDTSESAVKTREKLFTDLKEELELLATLEEQHLFPVLKKHKDLKDLVREALNDNKATRKLLTELEHTPKDSEEFGSRVAELRRVFQQHVRDEKKELLPAVLKALSDEEAEAVVEGFEATMAEVEEAKRAEAEERRSQARREREKAEAEQARTEAAQRAEAAERRALARQAREDAQRVQQVAETVVETAWAGPRTAQSATTAAREVIHTGLSTASDVAQLTTEQVSGVLDTVRQRGEHLTERASQNLQSVAQTGTALARNVQDVSSEYVRMVQARMQKNAEGIAAVMRSRTFPEFVAAQSALFRDNVELTMNNSLRLVELSTRMAETNTAQRGAQAKPSGAAV
jgi:hypothetical protein